MANTIKYQESWATALQERLKKPTCWKEVADVTYSDTQVFELPYVGTASESAIQTGLTRGNTYTFQDVTQSTETLTIGTFDILAELLDRADEAQSNYAKRMNRAALQGDKISERVEAIMLGMHGNWINIGDDGSGKVVTGSTTQLTITSTNVDDVIRAVIREVQIANAWTQYLRDGACLVWRPGDWEQMVAFMQANGNRFADDALDSGGNHIIGKKDTMGVYHYVSTSHTANHVYGGLRKANKIGLLNSTFGQVYITEDPAGSTGGNISGISVNSRLDYGTMTPAVIKAATFDINAA